VKKCRFCLSEDKKEPSEAIIASQTRQTCEISNDLLSQEWIAEKARKRINQELAGVYFLTSRLQNRKKFVETIINRELEEI